MFSYTINLFLHRDNKVKDGKYFVYVYVRNKTKTITLKTFRKVDAKFWDKKNQKIKRNVTDGMELNHYFSEIKKKVKSIIDTIIADNIDITFEDMSVKLKNQYYNINDKDFFKYFDEYIENMKIKVQANSIKKYVTLLNHLKKYESETKVKITFESINQYFYDNLFTYFTNKGMLVSTVNKLFDTLFAFMNYSLKRELHNNNKFKGIDKHENQYSTVISLNTDEIKAMETVQLTGYLDKARDLFLFALYTSQRYSDVSNFDVLDLEGDVWNLRQQKTKNSIRIRLNKKSLEILSKYNYKLPVISNQKANEYIKKVGELAGINSQIKDVKKVGANETTDIKPKYQMITFHTARHSYVTLAKLKGIDVDVLKATTGHKSNKQLSEYFVNDIIGNEVEIF